MKKIVKIQFGSHLYGTNTPLSDEDYKSVHLPSSREILLQRVQGSINNQRQKSEGEKNNPGDVDEESYSLQKYLSLLADGQTVAIDMLFAPEKSILESGPIWRVIQENRKRFISKRSAAFVGYCRTQANKYGIKGSRVAAAKQATEFFADALSMGYTIRVGDVEFGLRKLCDNEHSAIIQQVCNRAGDIGTYFECCNRKVDFNATVKQAHEIFSRIYQNYGNRARLAQDNEGIDWKALSHAVRVGREAIELLLTKRITFPLPCADHILSIKKGEKPYQEVAEEIEHLLVEVEEASAISTLPDNPDRDFINDLVAYHYRSVITDDLFVR